MGDKRKKRPDKLENVLEIVKDHVRLGRVLDTRHFKERQKERVVTFFRSYASTGNRLARKS